MPILKKIQKALEPRIGKLHHHPPRKIRDLSYSSDETTTISWPLISVVTPSYNQGEFVQKTIESVLSQQYQNFEYIVQDGNSTDDTVGKLKKNSDVRLQWRCENDLGQGNALNLAFSRTTGEIMTWLNSDDLVLPGAYNFVARFFMANPEIDVLYGNRILINEQGDEIGCWILPKHQNELLSWADFVPQETLYWRRGIWDAVGAKIDESYQFALDWDLLLRFREAGANIVHVDRLLGAFRVHSRQKTSAHMNSIGNIEIEKLRKKHLGFLPSKHQVRRALAAYFIKHRIKHFVFEEMKLVKN